MSPYIDVVNKVLAIGTVVLQISILVVFVNILFFRSAQNKTLTFFNKYGVLFAFFVALGSLALSLFYSEVIGYTACELCVVQRFFIYPQVFFLGFYLWKKKNFGINISALLAFFGMFVSMYHVYIENGGSSNLACVTGDINTVSCAARYVYEFGYITIPVMALTAQVFILLIMLNKRYFSKRETPIYTA